MKRVLLTATVLATLLVPATAAFPATRAPMPPGHELADSSDITLLDMRIRDARDVTPMSGTTELYGHTLTWALSGAGVAPAELSESYDGVVAPGASISFSGSAAFVIGEGGVTNLSQSASLSGADEGTSFSERVGGGTYTMPFSLTAKAPKVPAGSTAKKGDVVGSVSASVTSRNCNDSGMCGGPTVTVNLAVVLGASATTAKPADTEAPTVTLPAYTKIVTMGNMKKEFPGTTTYPVKIPFSVADNSGTVKIHARVYSNGKPISGADSTRFGGTGSYVYRIGRQPGGKGPYYLCMWAEDKAGNKSVNAPKSACTWLSLQVPVSKWANGCGSDGVAEGWLGQAALWVQNFVGDDRYYHGDRVQVRNACNVHDAAYAGVTLYDAIANQVIDFHTWSRAQIDQLFYEDIQRRCAKDLTSAQEKTWLPTCQGGFTLAQAEEYFVQMSTMPTADGENTGAAVAWTQLQDKVGAQLYLDLVRKHGAVGYDTDVSTAGTQTTAPGLTNPPGGERNNG